MRPAHNLVKNLNRRAFMAAGLSTAATALVQPTFTGDISRQAPPPASQWPETDASLAYIRKIGPEIERKTGMPFVAMDGTEIVAPTNYAPGNFLYAKQSDPLSAEYHAWQDNYLSSGLKDLPKGQGIANVKIMDKIYFMTAPKLDLNSNISFLAPDLLPPEQGKEFSLQKFLGPLSADDLVAFENYHELRHIFQNGGELSEDGLLASSVPARSLRQALYDDNGCESEADSFAALKFTSNTADRNDIPRRIEAVKIIARLRLLGTVSSGSESNIHDTYAALVQTARLIETAHNHNWAEVQAQFTEMYQRTNPETSLANNRQAARLNTGLLRGSGGIARLSDDQYRDLSSFIARAYSPSADQLLAMTMHSMKTSSDPDVQNDLLKIEKKFGPPSPEGQAYVESHVRLAAAAIKDGTTPTPMAAPKSRLVSPGL